jgi:excisionase family DNA binding protein
MSDASSNPSPSDEVLTLPELAAYLKLAERTVYGYAQRGILPGFKVCSAWRFRRADIQAWMEKQRQITDESTSKKTQSLKDKP